MSDAVDNVMQEAGMGAPLAPPAPVDNTAQPPSPAPENPQPSAQPNTAPLENGQDQSETVSAPGALILQKAQAAGFSTDEINQYRDQISGKAAAAGFNQQEINEYWGVKTPNMDGVNKIAATPGATIDDLTPANAAMRKEMMAAYARGDVKNPSEFAEAAQQTVLQDVETAVKNKLLQFGAYAVTGSPGTLISDILQNTVNLPLKGVTSLGAEAYLAAGGDLTPEQMIEAAQAIPTFGKLPKESQEMRDFANQELDYQPSTTGGKIAQAATSIAPYLLGGEASLLRKGVGALASGAGSVGGQEAAKSLGFGEEGQQVGQIIGGAPGMVFGAVPGEGKPAASETSVADTWKDQPKAQDFASAATATNGPKAATEVSEVLRNIYAEKGIHPAQVVADSKVAPTVAQDLAAGEIPKAYKPAEPEPTPPAPEPNVLEQQMADLEKQLDSGKGDPEEIKAKMDELADQRVAEIKAQPLYQDASETPKIASSVYQMMKPEDLTLDPSRFQYKAAGDGGVTGALRGVDTWEPALANPITAWQSDDGKTYVVNGHQRYDLAQRAQAGGQQGIEIPTRLFKESDGYTPQYMRKLGAWQNIAEGSGTAIDAAKVLRETPIPGERQLPGLPPKSQLVQQAHGLAALGDDSFGMAVNDVVPPAYAAEVGHAIREPKEQLAAMDVLAKAQPANVQQARLIVQDVKESGFLRGDQTSLFGDTQVAQSLFAERSKVLDNAMRQLRQLKSTFGTVINQEGVLKNAGNVLSRESNESAKATNEKIIATLQTDATRKGAISDALSDAARQLKSGQSVSAVTKGFLERVREINASAASDATGRSEGVRPGDTTGGNKPAQPGEQSELPGAGRISDRELAERKMQQPDRAGVAQQEANHGLFDEDARNQQAMFQRPAAPTFYSSLERGLDELPQSKASPAQWEGAIKNLTGVKKEEVEWSGISDWLKEQKGSVSKEAVMDYIRANSLDVQEVVKGDKTPTFEEWARDNTDGMPTAADRERYNRYVEHGDPRSGKLTDTKFGLHTLPGGENYHELLMKLPSNSGLKPLNGFNSPAEAARRAAASANDYKSSHFDEPNIVAHLRFNDRTDAAGKKVMFIEEVQSDWHQAGRKKGYQEKGAVAAAEKEIADAEKDYAAHRRTARFDALKQIQDGTFKEGRIRTFEHDGKTYHQPILGDHDWTTTPRESLEDAQHELAEHWADFGPEGREKAIRVARARDAQVMAHGSVPDAPFKTTWPELAFKRALRWAVENGHDSVAWTTGEQQADRYELSKQVEMIHYKKNADGTFEVKATPKNGADEIHLGENISEKDLPGIIGKDVAQKIVEGNSPESKYDEGFKFLKGVDLKVGGEGMSAFYDKMLPNMVNKLVKKWGGKVTETEIPGVDQVGPSKIYRGNTPTIKDVQKVFDVAKGNGEEKISPITGDRMQYSLTRVAVQSPVGKILRGMKDGRGFFEMMKEQGNDEIAKIFGGEMVDNPDAFKGAKVHSLDITPEMRESVMQGQPMFRNADNRSGVIPENATQIAPGIAAVPKAEYTAHEAAIEEAVNQEIARLTGGKTIAASAGRLFATGEKPGEVLGAATRVREDGMIHRLVIWSLESDDPMGTARHEVVHDLRRAGLITDDEWSTLEKAAQDGGWLKKHRIAGRYDGLTRSQQLEEAIAEEFRTSRSSNFSDVPAEPRTIFQKVADFFNNVAAKVRQIISKPEANAADIFDRIDSGEVGNREPSGNGGDGQGPRFQKTSEDRILDKIRVGGAEEEHAPLSWAGFYKSVVDRLDPIKRITDAIQRGDKSDVLNDTYKLMRNLAGNYGRAQGFIENHTFNFKDYVNTGKSLKDILAPVRDDVNGFRAYAVARRALELEDRGINSGMPISDVHTVIRDGAEKFEPIFKDLNKYQDALIKYMKDAGLFSDEQVAAMKGSNMSYVPFYRVMDENFGQPGGSKVRNLVKRIKGSDRDVIDPLESIVKNTYAYIDMAEKNAALKSFYDGAMASEHPEDFFTEQPARIAPTKVSADEMSRFLKKEGIEGVPEHTLTIFRAVRTPLARDEVGFFNDGKWKVLKVDPDLAEAFNGTPRAMHGFLFNMLALPAKMLRYGLIEPAFIIRHLERNTLSATVIGEKAKIPLENLYKGMFSYLNKDEAYEDWLKSGGKVSSLSGVTRNDVTDEMHRLTGEYPETNFLSKAWNIAKTPFDVIHAVQQSLENIQRLGAYKTAMEGLDVNKANIVDAGYYARNVAPDPSRIGSQTGLWNSVTALANTEIQHTSQIIDAFRNRPLPTLAKGFAFITLPTIINWAYNHNDPRYKEIPAWERDAFWITPVGGYMLRIPKPFLMGFLFATVPERILDAISGNDKDGRGMEAMVKDLFEQATPNTIPTGITPILEQMTNHSMFRGTPLVPDHLMHQLPEYRYNDYTSELTKAVGQLVGKVPFIGQTSMASPMVIDNYLRAWGGSMGQYVLSGADAALRKAGVLPDPVMPTASLADLPFIKAFVVRYPSAQAASIQQFQNDYRDMNMVTTTYKSLISQNQIQEANQLALNNPAAFAKLDAINSTIAKQNQLVRAIYKNPQIGADEKRQLIDSTYYQMIQIANAGNNLISTLKQMQKPTVH